MIWWVWLERCDIAELVLSQFAKSTESCRMSASTMPGPGVGILERDCLSEGDVLQVGKKGGENKVKSLCHGQEHVILLIDA